MTLPISLPTAPGVLDVSNTERATAADALRSLGVTQSGLAGQTAANRAAASQAITDSLDNTPLGTTPNVPKNLSGPVPLYVQPDFRNPAVRTGGVSSQANPMGL